jgi:hypothetical protein
MKCTISLHVPGERDVPIFELNNKEAISSTSHITYTALLAAIILVSKDLSFFRLPLDSSPQYFINLHNSHNNILHYIKGEISHYALVIIAP